MEQDLRKTTANKKVKCMLAPISAYKTIISYERKRLMHSYIPGNRM